MISDAAVPGLAAPCSWIPDAPLARRSGMTGLYDDLQKVDRSPLARAPKPA